MSYAYSQWLAVRLPPFRLQVTDQVVLRAQAGHRYPSLFVRGLHAHSQKYRCESW